MPTSPWRLAGNELLADGQWHERQELVQEMMRAVPFGMAVRRRRAKRDWKATQRDWDVQHLDVHLEHEARMGALSIASETACNAVRTGKWERQGDMYRLRP